MLDVMLAILSEGGLMSYSNKLGYTKHEHFICALE